MPIASSFQWETVRMPAEIVESRDSSTGNSGIQWNAVLVPASSEVKTPGNSSTRWRSVFTPVREEVGKTGDTSIQWDADFTAVKGGEVVANMPATDHETASATVLLGSEREKCQMPGESLNRHRARSSAA